MLTFVIPVRHQETVEDWAATKARIGITLRSLAAQDHDDWRAVLVANRGADLPPLPDRIEAVFVDLPRNELPTSGPLERRWEAIRKDKGARLLAGLVATRPTGHVMVVDYDDMVSRDLAGFVAANAEADGWFFDSGYVYSSQSPSVFFYEAGFHKFCGTCHIVRSDLLGIPARVEDATEELTCRWLGSHIYIADDLRARGRPLAPLPFVGAVYRIGYPGTTSGSQDLARFIDSCNLHDAIRERNLLRPVDPDLATCFFGGQVE